MVSGTLDKPGQTRQSLLEGANDVDSGYILKHTINARP
jgi:hypothetical protein